MELALSLGDTPKPFSFLEKSVQVAVVDEDQLGFRMAAGKLCTSGAENGGERTDDPPVQLDLMPFSPVHRSQSSILFTKFPFPWPAQNLIGEPRSELEVNRRTASLVNENPEDQTEAAAVAVSGFQMDSSVIRNEVGTKRDFDSLVSVNCSEQLVDSNDGGGSSSRGSDEDYENGMSRKKLRLTKEQSSFLEDSFKEHNTLNPRQKLSLAKQLNLRPRQVEVWFQNRRARTKLKQTEVDCEYLKKCCERLTEENRRLHKELQELRALKASQPFYEHLPPTTLTMCPACEKVATTSAATAGLSLIADQRATF
ncbi:hypothetical protein F511_07609 [Dorcoceras hygrometricum]|uniref:Homeobox domain-containing protein n=1 Tax=Dorcoceras hygrometricum TaxID=472368 RepID=A0A2Z7D243_9LAMI|nr:hypothetical protein F511_07609 [Dorcoceras hygrometricum]